MTSTTDPEIYADLDLIDQVAARAISNDPNFEAEQAWTGASARQSLESVRQAVHMGTIIPPNARLRKVKQALLLMFRPITSHQVPFNEGILHALEQVVSARDRSFATLRSSVATQEVTIAEQQELLTELEPMLEEIAKLRAELDVSRSEIAILRAKQDRIFRAIKEVAPEGFGEAELTNLARELGNSGDEIYRDLEATFRGSREAIRALLEPYVELLPKDVGAAPIIDVGSGRAEWLEVLADNGFSAYGLEINTEFVEDSLARGLDVRAGDALAHLRSLPDESASAITAFHVVEHLSLDTLVELVDQALRVLRPGGLLLFETPNPTNFTVGASSFYLDPTHLKPIHPQFLEFLAQTRGFTTTEIRFLHESSFEALPDSTISTQDMSPATKASLDHLNWSLFGPLDYALIAYKASQATK